MPIDLAGEFIRIRVEDPDKFDSDTFKPITISKSKGIKSVIGKYKTANKPEDSTHIQNYMFEKSKWDEEKAKKWIEDHKKSIEDLYVEIPDLLEVDIIETKQDEICMIKGFVKSFDTQFKVVDEEQRIIEGYVSKIGEDRTKDYVHPEAFKNTMEKYMENPVVTYMHKWDQPIGKVIEWKIDEIGLWIKCQISKGVEWADNAWNLIKDGVLKGFSYGYRSKDSKKVKGTNHIYDLDLYECAVVSVPMHADALFTISEKGMTVEMIDIYHPCNGDCKNRKALVKEEVVEKQYKEIISEVIGQFKLVLSQNEKDTKDEAVLDFVSPWVGKESISSQSEWLIFLYLGDVLLRKWYLWSDVDAKVGFENIKNQLNDKFGTKGIKEEVMLKILDDIETKVGMMISAKNKKLISKCVETMGEASRMLEGLMGNSDSTTDKSADITTEEIKVEKNQEFDEKLIALKDARNSITSLIEILRTNRRL